MKYLIILPAVIGALGAAMFFFSGADVAARSFGAGSLTTLFSLAVTVISWPRLLAKKQVALSIGVIVIKFLILGWIVFVVVGDPRFNVGWFAAGLGTVVPAVLFTGYLSPISSELNPETNTRL